MRPSHLNDLLKVGMPAAKQGMQESDPTIAELLKPRHTECQGAQVIDGTTSSSSSQSTLGET
jgi:hypothetical protein